MSASKMTTQKFEDFEEVALYDPALEDELFGEMDPALEEELFSSSESDITTSSPAASVDTSATSFDSEFFKVTPAPDNQPSREVRRLSRGEKRLSLEHRNPAPKASGWTVSTITAAQQKFDAGDGHEKSGDAPAAEMPLSSKPSKSAAQRALEEEKQAKLERRSKALQMSGQSHPLVPQTPFDMGTTQQKRKRGDEHGGGEKVTKREAPEAAAMKMRKPSTAPLPASKPKRKRGADDDDGEKPAKRGLTDAVAAGIAQDCQHEFSADLEKVAERRDSVSRIAEKSIAVDATKKVSNASKAEEQHLAPSSTVAATSTDDDSDDEMTRMLKDELAKPFIDEFSGDESDPEDPIVEEILQPLTEREKAIIAQQATVAHAKGKLPPTAEKLRQMVQMMLKARAKKAHNAPKNMSPLANDGTAAEEQEIEARPKSLPKSRKPAPAAAPVASSGFSPVFNANAAAKEQEIEQRPKLKPKSCKTAPATINNAGPAAAHTAPLPSAHKNAGDPPKDYAKLKNVELQKLCRERGLVVGGVKKDLVRRLAEYDDEIAAGEAPTGVKPKKERHVYSWMQEGRKERS